MPHPPAAARIGPGCVSRWRTCRCLPVAHLSVRRSPCSRHGAGRPGGVPRPFLHGDQQSSPLRNPLPGHAHLCRSPWASAKQLASRPMAMSASPCRSAAAASRSRSSALCPWPAPMPSPASCCRAALAHGVGDLRPWASAGLGIPAGFRTPSGSQLWSVIQDSLRKLR